MLIKESQSVLVLVDFQEKLMPAIENGVSIVNEATRLAKIAALLGVPIAITEQLPDKLGTTIVPLPDDTPRLVKDTFDACQTNLASILPADRSQIVIAGCESHVCLLQTALALIANGHEVFVVTNAVGSRRRIDYDVAIQRLNKAGAHLVTVEMVAFEWLGTAHHPQFRAVQALIK